MKHILTCVDLFCGAGGLSKGFLDAGYDVVLGVDYDDAALETFRKNHGHATAMKLDLYNHENLDQIVKFRCSCRGTSVPGVLLCRKNGHQ